MCYYNSLTIKKKELAQKYALLEEKVPEFAPIVIASGFEIPIWPILTAQQPDRFIKATWGLIPAWIKTDEQAMKLRISTLNARSETIHEKPAFKAASNLAQRCLIPSTGFFEWQTVGKKKYPYFIYIENQPIFSMAGLWEEWTDEKNVVHHTFSILTVEANPLMAQIHNTKKRMPAILPDKQAQLWLDTTLPVRDAARLLRPFDSAGLKAHTIRPIGGKTSKGESSSVHEPYTYPELSGQLSIFGS
ncbi:SOS response-associated peptidase [Arundinibacter roseus]|uniref:Abasic site processing protein n=1 Tax=Arundinibacter roseus TaxID=2070510 RepID=A0A4R4KCQ4_9BACT|nr:SOS response-associated peptidase [Arundinibacter roseus]TDB64506.1 SOS response-associated peptidase [Arundinibacter roseus]